VRERGGEGVGMGGETSAYFLNGDFLLLLLLKK
jgi:hypothetical protein